MNNSKIKIVWTEEGILNYSNLLSDALPHLQSAYCDTTAPEVASVLFSITNHILIEAAKATNKFVDLGKAPEERKPSVPPALKSSLREKAEALKHFNDSKASPLATQTEVNDALNKLKVAKPHNQNITRRHKVSIESERDNNLLQLLSGQPKDIFKAFKKARASQSQKLKLLQVGENTYSDD